MKVLNTSASSFSLQLSFTKSAFYKSYSITLAGVKNQISGFEMLSACQYAISSSDVINWLTICFIFNWKGVFTTPGTLFLVNQYISAHHQKCKLLTVVGHSFDRTFNLGRRRLRLKLKPKSLVAEQFLLYLLLGDFQADFDVLFYDR